MSFHQMAGRPQEEDEQGAGIKAAPIGSSERHLEQPQGLLEELDSCITYEEMQEFQQIMGELLHRIVESHLVLATRPWEASRN